MTTMNEERAGFEAVYGTIKPEDHASGDDQAIYELEWRAFKAGAAWQRAQTAGVPDVSAMEAQSAPAGDGRDGLPLVIAGAIFDFSGFLTTREGVIEVGATANASPVADLIQEWAELRGLSLADAAADAAVLSWQDLLAADPAHPAERQEQGEFGGAYQGAREDLAIWKRRALEAEEKLRNAEQSTPAAIEVIGYASPGQVEILRKLPRTGGMKVKGCADGRYTEPVVLLSVARAALFATVIRCEQAGAFKACMECGYQDGHDEICKFHGSNRAAHDQGEVQRLREALRDTARWIERLPVPTRGATRQLERIDAALAASAGQEV